MENVMWSTRQINQVMRVFGVSDIYSFALTQNPRLVDMIRLAISQELELEGLIQQLTRDGDESQIDFERANLLLQDLIKRRDGRKLLLELEQTESYRRSL